MSPRRAASRFDAGYAMPVQYRDGVLKEHLWTRESAGLFDVSHMGQARLRGVSPPGRQGWSRPTIPRSTCAVHGPPESEGGVIDDLMTARPDDDGLFIVVNGACKDNDYAIIAKALEGEATVERLEDRALLALQGPEAAAVLAAHVPEAASMVFMDTAALTAFGVDAIISRSGYTGEDGYEISVPAADATRIWNTLLEDERVKAIGLGARDSLRLEAGLPLYGHDMDETVSPIEAGMNFAIGKSRREAGDYLGVDRISKELAGELKRARVNLRVLEGAPPAKAPRSPMRPAPWSAWSPAAASAPASAAP